MLRDYLLITIAGVWDCQQIGLSYIGTEIQVEMKVNESLSYTHTHARNILAVCFKQVEQAKTTANWSILGMIDYD